MLKRFLQAASGNVSLIFSVSALALMGAAGMAVDYGRYNTTGVKLQTLADSAVLAAVRAKQEQPSIGEAEMQDVARRYFEQHDKHGAEIEELTLKELKTDGKGIGTFSVHLEATQPTTFMRLANIITMQHRIHTEASVGNAVPVEVALVLDVTGSMSGSRIAGLKSAAKGMLDTLLDPKDSQAKVAIVPFSDYVNVGLGNRNKPWISVPADYSETSYQCTTSKPVLEKKNCRKVTKTGTNDGVPYTYEQEQCDITYGPEETKCANKTTKYEWKGCVGSRGYPLNIQDSGYDAAKVPGLLNISCPSAVTELTNKKTTLVSQIDKLSASGNTYIPTGLVWGWRALTSHEPFGGAMSKSEAKKQAGVKALLLMTDGANVKSPRYPDHGGSNANLANTLLSEACANVKADDIQVYTIAFEVTDTKTRELLKSCASSASEYYDAENSAQLADAFKTIAGKLTSLYLNK